MKSNDQAAAEIGLLAAEMRAQGQDAVAGVLYALAAATELGMAGELLRHSTKYVNEMMRSVEASRRSLDN